MRTGKRGVPERQRRPTRNLGVRWLATAFAAPRRPESRATRFRRLRFSARPKRQQAAALQRGGRVERRGPEIAACRNGSEDPRGILECGGLPPLLPRQGGRRSSHLFSQATAIGLATEDTEDTEMEEGVLNFAYLGSWTGSEHFSVTSVSSVARSNERDLLVRLAPFDPLPVRYRTGKSLGGRLASASLS